MPFLSSMVTLSLMHFIRNLAGGGQCVFRAGRGREACLTSFMMAVGWVEESLVGVVEDGDQEESASMVWASRSRVEEIRRGIIASGHVVGPVWSSSSIVLLLLVRWTVEMESQTRDTHSCESLPDRDPF